MKININMIIICKQLANQYHMRDWIPLLKVWLGTELLSKQEYYKRADLINMTGLKETMIDKCSKILMSCNIYKKSRAYIGYRRCLGIQSDMNVENFYDLSKIGK